MSWDPRDGYAMDESDRARMGTVRWGIVREFDPKRARVRVTFDGSEVDEDDPQAAPQSAWLPWASWAAGHLRVWSPPAAGEQCLVLAPSGELTHAVAMPGVFAQKGEFPAPSDNPEHTLMQWYEANGEPAGFIRYERDTRRLILHAPCIVKIEGDLLVTGDVFAGDVSLRTHRHPNTGGPIGGASPQCQ